ncbi:hypothetical protein PEL8287_00833 [Roseovarius litorisediminis]|uniref:Thioesterase superfamily protein n=1 Tax=Roseovarius litorisediminis TaxID=1312363 RepID=A0A1Y5RLZ4_9RHOB|nr:acyl-CoA thioesterase [Roseovarius litorisediminis]SLN20215.1 hypothetical protein PEL8287_00833 [Roseovarius litorisediminis]
MYPVIRLFTQLIKHRNDPPLAITDTHVSRHRCLPWDIDLWLELNNGRTLTLYDLGRTTAAQRVGLIKVLRRNRWGLTMAGASVRYRRRIRTFEKFEMRSRLAWWDDKFFYVEQSMWKRNGECANHIVYRSAVTGSAGIIVPQQVVEEIDAQTIRPPAPEWIAAWIKAETKRPWPPMQE